MEEKNKKVIVPTIIAVVTLAVLVIGATYAYFRVATDNAFGTPKIDASTPSIGSVALSTGSNLTMNLTAEQMMQQIEYYTDDLKTCLEEAEDMGEDPEMYGCYAILDVLYYATPEGAVGVDPNEKLPLKYSIGTASVAGEGTYNCTYTLTIDDNENSLYDAFQTYNNKSLGQVLLTVNNETYDFNTANLFPLTIKGNMNIVNKNNPNYITARLMLLNDLTIDQSNLSGQNISLEFDVSDFSCTAIEEPPLCIRANELHEDEFVMYNYGSSFYGEKILKGEITTFGNSGTNGDELLAGNALTCDVNGDKIYDEKTERFYYISDYYNTTTKEFETDKAVLMYYNTVGNKVQYDASKENWNGPVTAITALPTTSEWSNVSLINPQRKIINEVDGNTVADMNGVTNELTSSFDYTGYSARLPIYKELNDFFNNCSGVACNIIKSGYYWLETPSSTSQYANMSVYSLSKNVYYKDRFFQIMSVTNKFNVQPVIEVYKTNINN